jgi:outer membrane receptor protein involved in Fe transport
VGYGQRESIESVFGSLRWNITDQLRINTGVRATADHKSFEGVIGYGKGTDTYGGLIPYPAALANAASVFLGPPGSYPYTRTDKALMPSAGIQYQIAPQAMSYFTYSRGFKAGGYNAIAPSPIGGANGAEPTFGPETVNSYELGLKSKWIDNRLLLNFDVFREDYTGLQINALTAVTSITYDIAVRNAANSVSQGAELETQWVVSDNVRLSADITYLDAYYKNFANAAPTVLQTQDGVKSQDLSGAPLDFASKWSGSVTAEYRANLAANYRLISDLSPFFQSQYFNSNGTDDPNDLIKASIRLDAKLTLEQTSQNWAIDLIGKNLTDRVIVVLPSSNEVPGGKQEPRTVAIQGRYKF